MSQSDDITTQINELYTSASLTIPVTISSLSGTPTVNWDSADTAGTGFKFGVGYFVQDNATRILYRCSDATPGAAVWTIIIQTNI